MRLRASIAALPGLVRFLALHALIGALLGMAVALALVLTDVAGLRGLFASTETPLAAGVLLLAFFALTFASLAMGSAIMLRPGTGAQHEDRREK